jgi:hypothetical protein
MPRSEYVVPEGFFAFSKPQSSERDLTEWKKWFHIKQIKTVIIRDEKRRYILCREGVESK